jgi:hypothetical protein
MCLRLFTNCTTNTYCHRNRNDEKTSKIHKQNKIIPSDNDVFFVDHFQKGDDFLFRIIYAMCIQSIKDKEQHHDPYRREQEASNGCHHAHFIVHLHDSLVAFGCLVVPIFSR